MKKLLIFLLPFLLFSCKKGSTSEPEYLKYSQKDVIPLTDSLKNLYYNDAALMELYDVMNDSTKIYIQTELDESKISEYYNDLIFIYNNACRLSNSFFENINKIHSHGTLILYNFTIEVDTTKKWPLNWLQGNLTTGISAVDSIVAYYQISIKFKTITDKYYFTAKSIKPVNVYAIRSLLMNTGEFDDVVPWVFVGGNGGISYRFLNNYKLYRYSYGNSDGPSEHLNYHYWTIRKDADNISLVEEGDN